MNEDNLKLINTALRERIGVIVSNYESDIASIRAEATVMIEALNNQNRELTEKVESLRHRLGDSDVAIQE